MGRVQMASALDNSPQLQPQMQAFPYPLQPQISPVQNVSYGQPENFAMANHNTNCLQPDVNVAAMPQYHQVSPLQMPQSSPNPPNSAPMGNNAATAIPMQTGKRTSLPVNGSNMINMVPWTTGLFDCMEDSNSALTTALFPCVTFGQIAYVLGEGHTTCATSGIIYAAAPCLMSGLYRRKLRQRFGLVEAPTSDWIAHSLFEPCALCQEYRELKNRGIDPALGYHGNLNKNQVHHNATIMVPPLNQMMN